MVHFYVLCSKNILIKLVGYQQLTSHGVKMEFVVRFHVNYFHFLKPGPALSQCSCFGPRAMVVG